MAQPRVIIVGAGPAGTRAAEALVRAGLRPMVIDEGQRSGGQIYRRQPEGFGRSYAKLYGTEAGRARDLHQSFEALLPHIDYRPETLVWNIADQHVWWSNAHDQDAAPFDALIVCSGATDRLMPVLGWHHAGCYSLGGAQVALKAQACAIGREVVFMGSGPLLYLVAAQYAAAGAKVAAVLDSAPASARVRAAPDMMALPGVLWNGIGLTLALRKARVPVLHGVTPVEIRGDADHGVTGLVYRTAGGDTREIACDAVAMGHHLRSETQLADLARCAFSFDPVSRQFLPDCDAEGRSSVPGVYLAGDGCRIRGARAAEAGGRLAALASLADLGLPVDPAERAHLLDAMADYARFARGLMRAFPWPQDQAASLPDAAIVCRCEAVTAGDLRQVCAKPARAKPRAKAFSRVGMGRCQGRYCGLAAAEVIAAETRVPVESVGRLRAQAPVKPLSISTGGMPHERAGQP